MVFGFQDLCLLLCTANANRDKNFDEDMKGHFQKFFESIDPQDSSLPNDNIIIGEDLAMISFNSKESAQMEPKKLDFAIIVLCIKGELNLKINLEVHNVKSPALVTIMPGQIVEPLDITDQIEIYTIALSKRFIDMVNIPGWQQQYMAIYKNPIHHLSDQELRALYIFYTMLYGAASNTENPFRLQVIENLLRVFYYGGVSSLPHSKESTMSKNPVVQRFTELVQEHYAKERLISFYADKLCITPKYLSKLVKENTGLAASDWIERHVILDARAMLQSSDMTIQQIAAALNFPNQSFFGKYFKRATGLSPKQYRESRSK